MAQSNRDLNSRPVVRIAIAGVTLGVALMILASAVVQGFQHEVKNLVVGFDSHVQISASDPGARGISWTTGMLDTLRHIPGVEHVSLRHERAGILETPSALKGVIVRGLDTTSRANRIQDGLLRGRMPSFKSTNDLLIGEPLARTLELDTGDRVTAYIVVGPDNIRPRPMRVVGIYETGLLEFDQRHVWLEAGLLQDAASRGAEGQVVLERSTLGTRAVGQAFGKTEQGSKWTGRWDNLPQGVSSSGRRSLSLMGLPQSANPMWIVGDGVLADTVRVQWSNSLGWQADVSSGTHRKVADGYDLWAEGLDGLSELQSRLFAAIPYDWQAASVDQQHPEMFSWLGMLDLNVDVIVGLMVLISIINMTSALLIIILERRQQVGLLKAMGMHDAAIVQTFMWHASRILGWGFLWGNVAGLGLTWIQARWRLVPLNPEAYYLDAVPILIDLPSILSMECIAFALCVCAMILPSLWTTRIQPAVTLRMH